MTSPDFALDLSHDGIILYRRAADGWRSLGTASLDADRMSEDLAALRERATETGGELATKLIIPNSQILYTSCPASGGDELADEVRVRAALVGATPYDVTDLVFDWQSDGETLQIAVVARETLDEARAFAAEHGFGPVGYVAVPPEGLFTREPFFGPADRGPTAGRPMVPDAEPVREVGPWVETPETAPVEEAEEEAAAEPEAPEAESSVVLEAPQHAPIALRKALDAEAAVTEAGQEAEPQEATPAEPDAEDASEGAEAPAMEGSEVAAADEADEATGTSTEEIEAPEVAAEAVEDGDTGTGTADEAPLDDVPAMPAFHSIRAAASEGRPPKLGGARGEEAAAPSRKLGGAKRNEKPASPPPRPERSAGPEAAGAKDDAKPKAGAKDEAAPETKPAIATGIKTDAPAELKEDPHAKAGFASFRDRVSALRRKPQPSTLTPEIIAAPLPKPKPEDLPGATPPAKTESAGLFAAASDAGGSKRRFPVVLTAALVLALGMVGLWSKLFLVDGDTAAGTETTVAEQSFVSATALAGGDGAVSRSITFADSGTSAATLPDESEADLAEALQAPATAPDAESEAVDMASVSDDPFSSLDDTPETPSEPMFAEPPELQPETDPELADSEPEPESPEAEPLTPEAARAAYDATGIWQRAPAVGDTPQDESTNDIYIASIDPGVTPHDAIALPLAEVNGGTDAPLPRQPGPMPPGQVVEFDENGEILPTEEGVVTPDGYTLYAGRPPAAPAPRPGSAAATAAAAEAQAEDDAAADAAADAAEAELAALRPRERPENLVEEAEKAQLGGRTRSELAGLRPKARPQSIQDEAQAARQAAIEAAVAESAAENADQSAEEAAEAQATAALRNASELAVASSRTPAARPRGFGQKVAAARQAQEAAEARARAEAEARARAEAEARAKAEAEERKTVARTVTVPRSQKVAPNLPTTATVAKAATDRNELKLRDINLIGVFGSPSQRRALVRLPSGRLVKVKPGDRLDGGQVAAIGQSALRYVKRGRNIVLEMPQG